MQRDDVIFVLRFWKEAPAGDSRSWRVKVNCVNTRARSYVDSVEAAFNLIRAALEDESDQAPAGA